MIKSHKHLCGGSTNPSEATMVCIEEGCSYFALFCNNSENCDCRVSHKHHSMKVLTDILSKKDQPVQLPEQYKKMEKDVNTLIDGLVNSLQQLKVSHKMHVDQCMDRQLGCGPLLRKLAQGEPLQLKEATGHCFYKLVDALKRAGDISNPYFLNPNQLKELFEVVNTQAGFLMERIERVWAPKRANKEEAAVQKFSSTLKLADIKLEEDNTRATLSGSYSTGLILVNECLSMTAPSKISFLVNQKGNGVHVGVCYQHRIGDYKPKLGKDKHGTYLQSNTGFINSDSFPNENEKQLSPVRFGKGNIVTMEFVPATGMLNYSSSGKTYAQRTSIKADTTEPVHFCVRLASNSQGICDVSVVSTE